MRREVPESEATGDLGRVYAEIRHYQAVANVSTIYRCLATIPGCMEWAWETLRPCIVTGAFPETAWRLADEIAVKPLAPFPPSLLRVVGIRAEDEAKIAAVLETYNRANPNNLLFATTLRLLLDGKVAPPGRRAGEATAGWQPPRPIPPIAPLVDPAAMDRDLVSFVGEITRRYAPDHRDFVPGIYRHLAHWPGFIAFAGSQIIPLIDSGIVIKAAERLVKTAEDAAVALADGLPPPSRPAPQGNDRDAALDIIAAIQPNMPIMLIMGRLLRGALPR